MIQPCFVMLICSIPILFLFPLRCLIHSEFAIFIFSRDKVTIRACVRPLVLLSVSMYVTLLLFGLLGATYSVYTALTNLYKSITIDSALSSYFQCDCQVPF